MPDYKETITHMSTPICYLSQTVLESLQLTYQEVIESIEHLINRRSQSQVWNAPKAVITPPDSRYMMATLAAANDPPFLAVKTLLLNPENPKRGLKSINSLVTLLDSDTGLPLAILDGNWITAVRTAGLSAVAAKRLAKSNASIAAFIGCGVQAHSHLDAFVECFPLKEIRVLGRSTANQDKFSQYAQAKGLSAIACETAQDAVNNADLIVTSVTLSPQLKPFLDAHWLKPSAFVTMTDLATPWFAESLSIFDRIVVDDLEQESSMEKPLVDPALVSGDLTGLVNGETQGRCTDNERTAFIFRGLALGDLAVAGLAYQRALKNAQGILIET